MASATLVAIHKFFSPTADQVAAGTPEYKLAKFRAEWAAMTDQDKAQIKAGLEDDTYNY